jgi:hypothetical protein
MQKNSMIQSINLLIMVEVLGYLKAALDWMNYVVQIFLVLIAL